MYMCIDAYIYIYIYICECLFIYVLMELFMYIYDKSIPSSLPIHIICVNMYMNNTLMIT